MNASHRLSQLATKVVATLGPASEPLLGELIDAGLSVARINLSHGTEEDHRRRVALVRATARERGVAIGILADLPGPKLRLGTMAGGRRTLKVGDLVRLVRAAHAGGAEVPCDFDGFPDAVEVGHRIFLADAVVELAAEKIEGGAVLARTLRGGEIGDKKGVHLPDSHFSFELPTERDRAHIALARELDVDMLGISFVSRAEEVQRIRSLAGEALLVAKMERRAAIDNHRRILEVSDGVMVARGDLGVELPLEEVPLVQKTLIQAALKAGKFTIVATEMLESMVTASRPTRAEVADVANAVLDGADAVMLSAETAVGAHPVEAVRTMVRIADTAADSERYHELPRTAFRDLEPTFSNATAMATAQAAEALGIRRILCFTEAGNTVRLLSRYRPTAAIIALTPSERTLRQMTILCQVLPVLAPRRKSLEEMLHDGQNLLLERGLVLPGEEVIFVAGVPPGVSRSTNVMKLHRIGEQVRLH